MKKWRIYLTERLTPAERIGTVIYFVAILMITTTLLNKGTPAEGTFEFKFSYILAFIVFFLHFVHIRTIDDVMDYEIDLKIKQDRPVARGLITTKEVLIFSAIILAVELIIAMFISKAAVVAQLMMMVFCYILYVDYWLPDFADKREIFCPLHTPVYCFQAFFVQAVVADQYPWQMDISMFYLFCFNWALYTVIGYNHDTRAPEQEYPGMDTYSYSQRLGPWGAVALAYISMLFYMFFTYILFIDLKAGPYLIMTIYIMTLILSLTALKFAIKNDVKSSKLYRMATDTSGLSACVLIIVYLLIF